MSDKEELCAECRVGNDGWEEGWVQKRSREFGWARRHETGWDKQGILSRLSGQIAKSSRRALENLELLFGDTSTVKSFCLLGFTSVKIEVVSKEKGYGPQINGREGKALWTMWPRRQGC